MGNLVCRIELHKKNGIIVTVENDTDQITQTMVFDGKKITTECKGQETSTITQKPESITIKCKDFLVDAETITCNSSKDTKLDSKAKTDILSSQNFTINSGAKLTATSSSDMSMAGSKVDIKGEKGDVSASGINVNLKAKADAKLDGLNASVKGKLKTDVDGSIVNVSSKGVLNASGKITSVEGSAVMKIGGGVLKVG